MIGIIRRILQGLIILGLLFVIIRPQVVPEPVRPFTQGLSQAVIGPAPTWPSFRETWIKRLEIASHIVPFLQKIPLTSAPETITADWIVSLMQVTFITEPLTKWERVKDSLWVAPTPPASASPSATASPLPSETLHN